VLFGGSDISRWSEHRRVRAGIGRKFQTPSIFPSLSVAENMEVALGCTEGTLRLLRQLAPHQRDRIDEVLTLVGLVDRRGLRAGALAHGEMQWLEIGMLLVQNPQLLLLDEPIAGMTRDERDRTGQLLQALARTHSIVVVEHDMEFMRQFAREVTVLHLGRVLMHGDVEAVQEDARVREIYLGPKRHSTPERPSLVAVSA
jgi:urea transport system ATP-binding protein